MIHIISMLDLSILHFLYSARTVPLTYFFIGASELGRWEIIGGLMLIVCIVLLFYKRYVDIVGLLTATLSSGIAVLVLKHLIHRPRPEWWYQAYPEDASFSFPSAHAGLAIAFYGFCLYLLLQSASNRVNRIAIGCMPVVIVLVGFSRLYLGVHYFTDVLAGFAIGFVCILLAIQLRLHLLKR